MSNRFFSPEDVRLILLSSNLKLAEVYEKFFHSVGLKVVGKFVNSNEMISFLKRKNETLSSSLVMLLDLSSPEGKRAAKELKEIDLGFRIILLTSESKSRLLEYEGLFDGVLYKPFTMDELFYVIEKCTLGLRTNGNN